MQIICIRLKYWISYNHMQKIGLKKKKTKQKYKYERRMNVNR